jgi:hypothetical protein
VHQAVALGGRPLLGDPIAHQFHANHQAFATHVSDDRVLVHEPAQAAEQVIADDLGIADEPSFKILIVASAAAPLTGLPPNVDAWRRVATS